MDPQKVHKAGCMLSLRLKDEMGVGATPAAWGGFNSPGGGSRFQRDRRAKWLEEAVCEVFNKRFSLTVRFVRIPLTAMRQYY
jgi:hypothetical protein